MKYSINYKRSAYEELLQLPANIVHKVLAAKTAYQKALSQCSQILRQAVAVLTGDIILLLLDADCSRW